MAIRVLTKSEHLAAQKLRLANIIILSSRLGLRKAHTYSIDTVLSVCYSSSHPDLSLSLGEGHGPIQSAVPDSPQVQVVLKDIQHHCELREHQRLHERERQRGLKLDFPLTWPRNVSELRMSWSSSNMVDNNKYMHTFVHVQVYVCSTLISLCKAKSTIYIITFQTLCSHDIHYLLFDPYLF